MSIDPTRPLVDIRNHPRICPECFAPVEFVRTDEDKTGPYEIWECTAAGRVRHQHCEDPEHLHVGKRNGPCADESHESRAGRYRVREYDYNRAFKKRARDRRNQERRVRQPRAKAAETS